MTFNRTKTFFPQYKEYQRWTLNDKFYNEKKLMLTMINIIDNDNANTRYKITLNPFLSVITFVNSL